MRMYDMAVLTIVLTSSAVPGSTVQTDSWELDCDHERLLFLRLVLGANEAVETC